MATSIIDNKDQKLSRLGKTDGTQLSRRAYNAVIGAVLAAGLLLNAFIVTYMPAVTIDMMYESPILFIIGFLAVSFGAIYVIYKSDNPAVSFTGFIFLSIAFGFLLGVTVQAYAEVTVTRAFMLTAAITVAMVLLATAFPAVFAKMGRALFAVLVVTLVAEIATVFITQSDPVWFDIIFVVVFSLYIGYDWQKAQAYPPTLDNAVDSAADIYVDIINLFVRLLAILARSRN